MLNKLKGLFTRRTLALTREEMSQVKNLPADMQVGEALFREFLKQNPKFYKTIQERVKGRNSFHAGFQAGREFGKLRR